MKRILLSLFCLIAGLSLVACYPCSDAFPSLSYDCSQAGSAHMIDPNLLHGSSGQRALAVTFNVKVNSLCSVTANPIHLVVVTVTPPGGTEKRLFDFTADTSAKYVLGSSESTSGVSNLMSYSYTNLNDWMTFVGSVDLSTGALGMGAWFSSTLGVPSSSKSYGTWEVDSTLRIYLCSDVGGANPFSCDISDLKVIYKAYSTRIPTLLGSTPVRYADYRLDEGTGYITKDSLTGAQPAYFGAATSSAPDSTNSSPTWSSPGPGLVFADSTKYITMPTYTLQPLVGRTGTKSVSITLWIKLTAFPSSGYQYIYRYSSADLSTNRFSIQLTSSQSILCTYGSGSASSSGTLSTSTWTMIAARFTELGGSFSGSNYYISINFGSTIVQQNPLSASTLPTFASDDVTRLGGFAGEIANIQIFTPGVQVVNGPSCSVGCTIDLGNLNPGYCILPIQCPDGKYADNFVCKECPQGCSKCTSPTTCQGCQSGYGLQNNVCAQCPTSEYQTINNLCVLACQSPCATCSGTSTSCDSCISNYGLISSHTCGLCPSGQYADNSQCLACQSPCATCSSTSTHCDTCIPDFKITSSNTCESCLPNDPQCLVCQSPCATCSGTPTNCDSCLSGYGFTSAHTCGLCPSGKYLDNSQCLPCQSPCATCSGTSTHCDSCITDFTLTNSHTCLSCPSGKYLDNSQCLPCESPCATCSGKATTCTSCVENLVLQESTCVTKTSESFPVVLVMGSSVVAVATVSTAIFLVVRCIKQRKSQNRVVSLRQTIKRVVKPNYYGNVRQISPLSSPLPSPL